MEENKSKTTAVKATSMSKKVRQLTKAMNQKVHAASAAGEPIAYCFFGGSYEEILLAMGITPFWNENWAALCGAKRDTERFISAAEAEGYSRDLCSYLTTGLGFEIMRSRL